MALITREEKGSKLTIAEMDGNLTYLDNKVPYKVYTALLTQSGGDDSQTFAWEDGESIPLFPELLTGVTYYIDSNGSNTDFTICGSPNNNDETSFVANGIQPTWQSPLSGEYIQLEWNLGAPIVTVLENTIGNIWFEYYDDGGTYDIKSDALFTDNKTTFSINLMGEDVGTGYFCLGSIMNNSTNRITTGTPDTGEIDDILIFKTPIEIRVYN